MACGKSELLLIHVTKRRNFYEKKSTFNKIVAVMICVSLNIFTLPNTKDTSLTAFATESRSGNYSKNYTLTGKGAIDMINIGLAQRDRGQSSLGYTEAWCADFVCDCAVLANQESAIPFNGNVASLRSAVLSAGGSQVSSPQAGDLVCYYCNSCGRYVHVGLMINSTNSIQGNYSNKVSYVSSPSYYSDAYGHTCSSGTVSYNFVRPNYVDHNPAPSKPSISVSASDSEHNVIVSWNACENTTNYDIRVYNANNDELVYAIGRTFWKSGKIYRYKLFNEIFSRSNT